MIVKSKKLEEARERSACMMNHLIQNGNNCFRDYPNFDFDLPSVFHAPGLVPSFPSLSFSCLQIGPHDVEIKYFARDCCRLLIPPLPLGKWRVNSLQYFMLGLSRWGILLSFLISSKLLLMPVGLLRAKQSVSKLQQFHIHSTRLLMINFEMERIIVQQLFYSNWRCKYQRRTTRSL